MNQRSSESHLGAVNVENSVWMAGKAHPTRAASVSFERNLGFWPACQSLSHGTSPHPHPGEGPCPSPAAECHESCVLPLFRFKLSLLDMGPEHLLEQLTVRGLDVTLVTVEAARQPCPLPVGMASEGGKPIGWVGRVQVRAIREILGIQV